MIYEVSIGDYQFKFNNFFDAAKLADTIADSGEVSRYVDDGEGGYRQEWKKIEQVTIRVKREDA